MSAFMVSKRHIDLLVDTAINGPKGSDPQTWWFYFRNHNLANVYDIDLMSDLGEMLVKENLSSIHGRYPDTIENSDDTPGPIEHYWLKPYQFEDRQQRLSAVEALKAISCYEYQSCEHPEWESSEAKRFCEALQNALIPELPGYQEAAWGIYEEEGAQ